MKNKHFGVGKLPQNVLAELLLKIKIGDKSVVIPPSVGEDSAVIEIENKYLVLKTDPITFTAENIGFYSITINSNDIYVMGAKPRWFLMSLLLPESRTDRKLIDEIFDEILESCEKEGITLCGGHTEITLGLTRPIITGFLIGEVEKDKLIDKRNIETGDFILLVKGLAIETTSIIAAEKKDEVVKQFGENFYKKCKKYIYEPGISVKRPVELIINEIEISGMHDPTEGGFLGGMTELCTYIKKGFSVDLDKIKVYEESRKLCNFYDINPYRSIASGALLLITKKEYAEKSKNILNVNGIPCEIIGRITKHPKEYLVITNGKEERIKPPVIDEISKIF